MRENAAFGRRKEVHPSSYPRALIVHNSKEFVVDLERCQCCCLQFQDLRIPYPHAVAFALFLNKEPLVDSDKFYSWDSYQIISRNEVLPISRESVSSLRSDHLLPPFAQKPRGFLASNYQLCMR